MNFDNSNVRRRDRLMDREASLGILKSGEYGILSINGNDNAAYGIPLNYVIDSDNIYIHCAPEGKKLRLVENDNRVSFCVVGKTDVRPALFTTGYQSVIVEGQARIVKDNKEKIRVLELLVAKYSPEHVDTGIKYIEKSISRTAVISIRIVTISGKNKL